MRRRKGEDMENGVMFDLAEFVKVVPEKPAPPLDLYCICAVWRGWWKIHAPSGGFTDLVAANKFADHLQSTGWTHARIYRVRDKEAL
jgi:hypothetical protein